MRMMLIAGLLITLPAIAVILIGLLQGRPWMVLGAVASLAVNSLPFLVGMYFFRGRNGGDHTAH